MTKLVLSFAFAVLMSHAAFAESFQSTKIKQCSVEYKAAKAKGDDVSAGWPKFWSACAKAHKDDTFLTRKEAKAAK